MLPYHQIPNEIRAWKSFPLDLWRDIFNALICATGSCWKVQPTFPELRLRLVSHHLYFVPGWKMNGKKSCAFETNCCNAVRRGTWCLLNYCRSSADSTNLMCYDSVCDSQSAVSVPSQINLVRIFPHHSFDVYFSLIFRSMLTSPKHFIVFRFHARRDASVDGRMKLKLIYKKRDGAMDWIDLA